MLEQKYSNWLIETSILRAKEIPIEDLRQPKSTKNEEILPYTIAYNPNNSNASAVLK